MTTISRRSFLGAASISMGALASPVFSGRPLMNQSRQQSAEMNMRVWIASQRVHFQLWHFGNRLLPLLLRSPRMDGNWRYLGFGEPHPDYMTAHRHAADHLIKALPINDDDDSITPDSITPFDHHDAFEPIRLVTGDNASCRLLPRSEAEIFQDCCFSIRDDRICWDLHAMGPRFPQDTLEAYAEEIATFTEGPRSSNPIVSVRNARQQQLMRAFATMPLETYWNLILPLFHIAPEAPYELLTVRRSNSTMLFGDIVRPMEHSYLYSTQMSMLSSFIMEHFANNHFRRIQEIAGLRETWGNWHGFMAGQILDVLYQKVLVLRRLASGAMMS